MKQKRILLVDDEPSIRSLVQVCLETLKNWQVTTAASAREGMSKAQSESPDAILLDVMMPETDGLAMLEQLREDPTTRAIPVILLTAKIQDANCLKYAQLDVAGAIGKPFDALKLPQQIAELLNWQ